MAGKNIYLRFTCSTGDAMGMNMVSKGVQNVLDFLQNDFPDMDIIGISGNFQFLFHFNGWDFLDRSLVSLHDVMNTTNVVYAITLCLFLSPINYIVVSFMKVVQLHYLISFSVIFWRFGLFYIILYCFRSYLIWTGYLCHIMVLLKSFCLNSNLSLICLSACFKKKGWSTNMYVTQCYLLEWSYFLNLLLLCVLLVFNSFIMWNQV